MDAARQHIQLNRRRLIVAVCLFFTFFVVMFFVNNSVVKISVSDTATKTEGALVRISVDGHPKTEIRVGSSRYVVLPRQAIFLRAETNHEITTTQYQPGWFTSKVSIPLYAQVASEKLGSDGTCAYKKNIVVYTWDCNTPSVRLRATTYDGARYPLPEDVATYAQSFQYAVPYLNGFLAFGKIEEPLLNYVDLSGETPTISALDISALASSDFSFDSLSVLVDTKGGLGFTVVDRVGLRYILFRDVSDSLPVSGRLPVQTKGGVGVLPIQLDDTTLVAYSGVGSAAMIDSKIPSSALESSKELIGINLTNNAVKQFSFKLPVGALCDGGAYVTKIFACTDGDHLSVFSLDGSVTKAKTELSNSQGVLAFEGRLFVLNGSAVYEYLPSNLFRGIFTVKDRNMATIYAAQGGLYASNWFSYQPGSEVALTYALSLDQKEVYPRILDSLPMSIGSSNILLGSDFFENNIYINLNIESSYSGFGIHTQSPSIIEKEVKAKKSQATELLQQSGVDTKNTVVHFYY